MLLLAIDTTGPDCAVALARSTARGADVLVRAVERIGRGHAERLMPMIEAALSEEGVGFSELDRIAVTSGPGSFTGVRVGIAAARGLALALDIPALGVGRLDALAYPVLSANGKGTVVAVLDARRDEVYALARDIASGKALIEAGAFSVAGLGKRLRRARRPLLLTGSGASLLADALDGGEVHIVGTEESPDIADVAALGLAAGEAPLPTPLYLRGADAKPQADKAVARL